MEPARDRIAFELLVHRRAGLRRWQPRAAVAAPAPPAVTPTLARDLFVPASAPAAAPTERLAALAAVAAEVAACTRCKLCEQRTTTVPGEGALDPPILFVGEGPGAEEDRTGRPFVGRAGQLLDKMIAAIGLKRGEVFIANIVKCRPPENRTPEPDEVRACMPFLERQIATLRPRIVCTLGLPATRALLPEVRAISAVRGRQLQARGLTIVPTFHPAYLLRNPAAKREAWEDLQLVAKLIDRPVAGR
jgi:DNA polymerase